MAWVVCRPVWFVAAFSVAVLGCTRENPAFDRHADVETRGGTSTEETEQTDGSTSRGQGDGSGTGWGETGIDPTERMTSSEDGTPADDGDPIGCPENSLPECKTGDVQPCNVGTGERTCIDCRWDISGCCECEDGDQKSCHEVEVFEGQGFVVCNGCQWENVDEDLGCCRSSGAPCELGLLDCCFGTTCEPVDGTWRCIGQ